ncbi:Dps family protein [Jeotgalibacillus sp. R-1-5s-1]|uniref:Dps family protein n=1 Tax=Jeotgalibacillus sp. R-1-5s-1 TaxID=2555897 RepID=UPI001FC7C15A|nr:Dps family protein [Jeotgalibacillus sp. R-1-5s-1]
MMSANPNLVKNVNKQIASWTVLYTKLHNFHWYVKGHQFFTLHEKFEELYNEAALHIDELAERLLALKGEPVATLKESLELSLVEEAKGNETADQMVESLYDDFETLMNDLKTGMELAQKDDDEMTSDMLLSIHQSLEKHAWMLRSFLGK